MADEAATGAVGYGPVVSVDISDNIARDELLEVSGRDRTGVHGSVVNGLRIRKHHDHLFRALRKGAFDRLRHVDFVCPLLGADGIAVQGINHRIAPRLRLGVAGRQEDDNVAVDRVPFQVALQGSPVNLNVLHGNRLRVGLYRGHLSAYLCSECKTGSEGDSQGQRPQPCCCFHNDLSWFQYSIRGYLLLPLRV